MGYKWTFAIVILAIAYLYYSRTKVELSPIVKTDSGSIQGIISKSRDGREFYSYFKVPYAQPPLEALRFSSPKPVEKWEGVRDGSVIGPGCSQGQFLFPMAFNVNEDCLFLNIYIPKLAEKKLLPVSVMIHGGAYVGGSAEMIQPGYFMDEDIIFVSIQYRLGVLGFLSTGDKNIRGNMGLKDQTLALKWIKNNIQYFGGDSNRIQIVGQSAGASSVHYLLLSKSTKGLFNTAVSMSGTSILPWAFAPSEVSIERTKSYAKTLNCPTDDNAKLVECLRAIDVSELMKAYTKFGGKLNILYPSKDGVLIVPTVEVVDDEEAFLTESPYDIIAQGKAHRVPWMSGLSRDEGLIGTLEFYRDEKALDFFENNWEKCIQQSFYLEPVHTSEQASKITQKLREFYFPSNKQLSRDERISIYTKLFSDAQFVVGSSEVASVQRQFSPVYLYLYNITDTSEVMSDLFANLQDEYHPLIGIGLYAIKAIWNNYIMGHPFPDYGVLHAADAIMFFPMLPFEPFQISKHHKYYQLSKSFVKLLVTFANYDEKTILELRGTKFEPVPKTGPLKYLEVIDEPKMILDPWAERMAFWKFINYTQLFSSYNKNIKTVTS